MDRDTVSGLVGEHCSLDPPYKTMVIAMLMRSGFGRRDMGDIGQKIATISFRMQPTTPSDDDTYWCFRNPFDGKYYLFAGGMGGGFPTEPCEVTTTYPSQMEGD